MAYLSRWYDCPPPGLRLAVRSQVDPDPHTDSVGRSDHGIGTEALIGALEHVGAGDRAVLLKEHVRRRARNYTKLLPSACAEGAPRSRDWRLLANAAVEPDK